MAKKKPFVVDYEVVGTLVINAPNANAAAWRGRAIVERSLRDLDDSSAYIDTDIAEPIDMQKRYGIAKQR